MRNLLIVLLLLQLSCTSNKVFKQKSENAKFIISNYAFSDKTREYKIKNILNNKINSLYIFRENRTDNFIVKIIPYDNINKTENYKNYWISATDTFSNGFKYLERSFLMNKNTSIIRYKFIPISEIEKEMILFLFPQKIYLKANFDKIIGFVHWVEFDQSQLYKSK